MSEEVGLVSASPAAQDAGLSPQLQGQIDAAVRSLLHNQMGRAEALIREHRTAVEAIADALLEREVLDAEEVLEIAVAHHVPVRLPDLAA